MHQLQDAAEAEPEEERACDRQQRRAQLVRPPFAEHAVDQSPGLCVQPEVMHEAVRQRVGMRVQILLHHEQRRQNRNQDVQREQSGLERPLD